MRERGLGLLVLGLSGVLACGGRSLVLLAGDDSADGANVAGAPSAGSGHVAGGQSFGAARNDGGAQGAGAPNGGAPNGGAPNGGAPSAGSPSLPTAGGSAAGGESTDAPWEVQQLARIRGGIVGLWVGTATFRGGIPCQTTLAFNVDGSYTAHSPGESCVVFYYGTNDDSPEKVYLIDDVTAAAEGTGSIQIYFAPGDTNNGDIKQMALGPDALTLTFKVFKDGYGPIEFVLQRIIPK